MLISKERPDHPSLDYEFLRQEGIRHLENLATEIWTDFNVHDPGITLLEVLCYAITDLGYRTRRIPMADLMADPQGESPFFAPMEVLPAGPITALDYRKLLIDLEGVKNAWIKPSRNKALYVGDDKKTTEIKEREWYLSGDKNIKFKNLTKKEGNHIVKNDEAIAKIVDDLFPDLQDKSKHIFLLTTWATNGLTLAHWKTIQGKETDSVSSPSYADQRLLAEALLCEHGYFEVDIKPSDTNSLLLGGLLEIIIDLDDHLNPNNRKHVKDITNKVLGQLHAHRPLGQDYALPLHFVERRPIAVCMHLEVEDQANEVEAAAEAFWQLERHLSPELRFYTFREMRQKGYRVDEIYNGPLLEHGFLDSQEVQQAELRTVICHSDLAHAAKVKSVRSVHDLKVKLFPTDGKDASFESKTVYELEGSRPLLDLHNSQLFVSSRGQVRRLVRESELIEPLRRRRLLFQNYALIGGHSAPTGSVREGLGEHVSVQYDLPALYGVGDHANGNDPVQQQQREQLQAYLSFFDQILASYLGQLAQVRDLLSVTPATDEKGNIAVLKRTTYAAPLWNNIPGMKDMLMEEKNLRTESPAVQRARLDRALTHLLSRFGESFSEYTVTLLRADEGPEDDPFRRDFSTYLNQKATYLRDLPSLRRHVYRGYNYRDPNVWNTPNVAGIQRLVHQKMGLQGSWYTQSLIPQPVYRLDIERVRSRTNALQYQIVFKVLGDALPKVNNQAVDIPFGGLLLRSERYNSEKAALDKRDELYTETWNPANYLVKDHPKESGKSAVLFKIGTGKPSLYSQGFTKVEGNMGEADRLNDYIQELVQYIPNGELEAFHVLEHILLRPDDPRDKDTLLQLSPGCDPTTAPAESYSNQLTVVVPNWTPKFSQKRFQERFEQTFRQELPAYLSVRFCWVGKLAMRDFEERYLAWMTAKAKCTPDNCQVTDEAKALITWLNETPCSCNCQSEDQWKSPCDETHHH